MAEERILKEKISLLEKEIITLTERLEGISTSIREMENIRVELKGIKMFIMKKYPEFKKEFSTIIQKIES